MKKFFRITTLMLMTLFVLTVIASADKAEYKAAGYNYSKVVKIYVDTDANYKDGLEISDMNELKVREAIENNKSAVKKFELTRNRDIADAIVTIDILSWGSNKYWHEPRTVYEDKTITEKDKDGKVSTITIPVPVDKPGYYSYTEYFSARFTLTDRDGQKIYERIDSREDEKNATSMFGRAVKDFYKSLNKLK